MANLNYKKQLVKVHNNNLKIVFTNKNYRKVDSAKNHKKYNMINN